MSKDRLPETVESWGKAGLQRFDDLEFQPGRGALEGSEVAILNRDPETLRTVAMVRILPTKIHEESLEYHTGASHSVVLEGLIYGTIRGERIVMRPWDYYRYPANQIHSDAGSEEGAVAFMVSDGPFETVAVAVEGWSGHPRPTLPWGKPGLQRFSELVFEEGRGTFAGTRVAIVGKDEKSGAMAAFLELPPSSLEDKPLHLHTCASHTVVLQGSIQSIIDGEVHTARTGDYYRFAAGTPLVSTVSESGALMFVLTEAEFETVILEP